MTGKMDKTILVYDRGLFAHVALRLGRDFKKVLYYLAEENPNPLMAHSSIGAGFPEIEVVHDLFAALKRVDAVVFPDCNNAGFPEGLKRFGKKVYAAMGAERLEENRVLLKRTLEEMGLPVIPWQYVKGVDALEEHLEDKEDLYIKVNEYRGNLETFHFENSFLASSFFQCLRHEAGNSANDFEFVVEEAMPAAVEIGFESPMIDGKVVKNCMVGYESKDKAYLGKVFPRLPKIIEETHAQMLPAFQRRGYQAWFSNEIRITDDGTPYLIDLTCRCGFPPSGSYSELYENFPESVWELANGKLPKLIPSAMFAAEIILTSNAAIKDWLPIQFPDDISRWVKLKNPKKSEGGYFIIPGTHGYFGSVVALGETMDEAIETALARAELIKGDGVEYDKNAFDEILDSVEAGREFGIDF